MQKKIVKSEFNESLMRNYERTKREWLMERDSPFTKRELIEYVIANCQHPYFINYERAVRIIHKAIALGGTRIFPQNSKLTLSQQRWVELFGKVVDYKASHPCVKINDVIAHILRTGNESRYFIGYEQAKFIINYMEKQKRNELRPFYHLSRL